MNTKVTWVDTRRLLVETPSGDDFIVGFATNSNHRIERQSVFKVSHDLGVLFDKHYKGDSSVIMGAITRDLMNLCYESILFFENFSETKKDEERIRIGQRIKEIRMAKCLDAKTLASIAGIDAANLCRIEAGKYSVGFDILSKIASVCGKKIDFVDSEDNDHECIINIRPK